MEKIYMVVVFKLSEQNKKQFEKAKEILLVYSSHEEAQHMMEKMNANFALINGKLGPNALHCSVEEHWLEKKV